MDSPKELYRPLFLITYLTIIQQFSGMTIIRSYVVKIFNSLGDKGNVGKVQSNAYICAIVISIIRLCASISLSKLSKTLKRRSLYYISAGLTFLSLIFIGTCTYVIRNEVFQEREGNITFWLTLLSSCMLAFSVQIGIQSMPHLLSGELYPGDIRAKGKSISRAITCVMLLSTLKLYLPMKNVMMDYGVFFMNAGIIILSVPLTYFKDVCGKGDDILSSNWFYIPETRDVKLEHIQYLYTQKSTESNP